ncbi:MAG: hypothetical protein HPY57_15750 [Ignavibacteria bacterium]|nr:hypothetical protein [Ignavibacteria bacterium]
MDDFFKHIKSILENYEMPYDENEWLKIQKTLRVRKLKRLLKYTSIGVTSIIFFVFSVIYLSNNNNKNTLNISKVKQPLKIEIPIEKIVILNDESYIVDINTTKKEEILLEDIQEYKPIIDETEFVQNIVIEDKDTINIIENNILYNDDIVSIKTDSTYTDSLLVDTTNIGIIKPTYYLPTAFSPNGDGVNDEFFVVGVDLTNINFQLLIYDRWGNKVFETMTPDYKWTGDNYKQGVYIWIFRYQDNDGIIHIDKGQVTLIK